MGVSVILMDGKQLALADGATALDAARAISPKLADAVVVARVDGNVQDLRAPLHDGARLELLKADSPEGRDTINHSAEHLLALAVRNLFPGAKLTHPLIPPTPCDKLQDSEEVTEEGLFA